MNTAMPVGVLLKIIEKEICRRLNEIAGQYGLTYAQMHVLHFICRKSGEVCQRDLERRFDLTHATVSGLIDRLESKGFIEVRADPADKRRRVLWSTEKAEDCEGDVHRTIHISDAQLLHGFTAEEQAQFRSFLERLLRNLGIENVTEKPNL